jgi:hypothetical protein
MNIHSLAGNLCHETILRNKKITSHNYTVLHCTKKGTVARDRIFGSRWFGWIELKIKRLLHIFLGKQLIGSQIHSGQMYKPLETLRAMRPRCS